MIIKEKKKVNVRIQKKATTKGLEPSIFRSEVGRHIH